MPQRARQVSRRPSRNPEPPLYRWRLLFANRGRVSPRNHRRRSMTEDHQHRRANACPADFDKACDEFHRILWPGGVFVALWNPRFIEANPLLVELEAQIAGLKPDIRRVSSGRSGITERLTDVLNAKPQFTEVLYLEGRHCLLQTPAQYVGAWRSVNDLQVQLGPDLFGELLDFPRSASLSGGDRDNLCDLCLGGAARLGPAEIVS
jgi:hypothetical protein